MQSRARRRLNKNRIKLFGGTAKRTIAFLCECRATNCRETVVLSGAEYEARSSRGDSVVHPRHLVHGDALGERYRLRPTAVCRGYR